jgi:ribosome-associated toxin RatA of RatAB toxin-antitoxin module
MTTVTRTAVLPATPDEVWAVLADFESISSWADFVDHSSLLTEQTEDVGMTRRIQMGRTTVVETVTSWDPGVTLSYEITGLPPVIRSVTNTWRLGASGEDTMAWVETHIRTGPRPPQKAIAKAVGKRLANSSVEMLEGLNAHFLEKRPS